MAVTDVTLETLSPGDVVGPYRLDTVLGRGGFAVVYEATDTRTGKVVAVKTLRVNLADENSRRACKRFAQEIEAVRQLDHPSFVKLFDDGLVEQGGSLVAYYGMEKLDGQTLAQRVEKQGALPVLSALDLVAQVAAALHLAHGRGIIHRDIKPENLVLTAGGRVVVLDFGICRLKDTEALTATGNLVGTTQYLAPEGMSGQAPHARWDVFALGAVLFYLVTGQPVRLARDVARIFADIQKDGDVARVDEVPGIPSSLKPVLRKALSRDPAQRYATAQDLAQELRALLPASSSDTVPSLEFDDVTLPAGATLRPAVTESGTVSIPLPVQPVPPGRGPLWAASGLGVGVALGLLLAAALHRDPPPPPVLPPPPPAPAVEPQVEEARWQLLSGNAEDAAALAGQALEAPNPPAEAWLLRALSLRQLQRPCDARDLLQRFLVTTTDVGLKERVPALLEDAVRACTAPRPAPAARAVKPEGNAVVAARSVEAGSLALVRGELSEALREAEVALRLDPSAAEAHKLAGQVLKRLDRLCAARLHFQRFLDLNPRSTVRDRVRAELKSLDAAHCGGAPGTENAQDARRLLDEASVAMVRGELDQAVVKAQRTLDLDAEAAEAHRVLGIVLLKQGQPCRAKPHLQRYVQAAPRSATAPRLKELLKGPELTRCP